MRKRCFYSVESSQNEEMITVGLPKLFVAFQVTVVLNAKDLKIETKRSSGAGGQHVNTTDSCVCLTHIPSGQHVLIIPE